MLPRSTYSVPPSPPAPPFSLSCSVCLVVSASWFHSPVPTKPLLHACVSLFQDSLGRDQAPHGWRSSHVQLILGLITCPWSQGHVTQMWLVTQKISLFLKKEVWVWQALGVPGASVLASCGCDNKSGEVKDLKNTRCILPHLQEAGRLKSRCQQGCHRGRFLPRLFQLLVAQGFVPWLVASLPSLPLMSCGLLRPEHLCLILLF